MATKTLGYFGASERLQDNSCRVGLRLPFLERLPSQEASYFSLMPQEQPRSSMSVGGGVIETLCIGIPAGKGKDQGSLPL